MTQLQDKPSEATLGPNEPRRHRFTVAELEQAHAAGAFGQKRLELIEGEVIDMPPMGDDHVDWLARLTKKLVRAYGDVAEIISQVPLLLEENDSQPEPDFMVVKLEDYHKRKVQAREAAFVIEVSDSTLEFDRGQKMRVYARNGVGELWILNVKQVQLEVYREPQGDQYGSKRTLNVGDAVEALEFPGVEVEWWT